MRDDYSKLGYGASYFATVNAAFLRKLAKLLVESRYSDAEKARVLKAVERELSAPLEEAKRHERRD